MIGKSIWQLGIIGVMVAATAGTVALAADSLAGTASTGSGPSSVEGPGDDRGSAPGGDRIGIDRVIGIMTDAGYRDIREIEREAGGYEVEARDGAGRLWEVVVDGRTGEIIGREGE